MSTIARSDNDWQRHSATRHRHEGEYQDRFGNTYKVVEATEMHGLRRSDVLDGPVYYLRGSGPSDGALVSQARLDFDYIRIS